jgi:hypothetical protein
VVAADVLDLKLLRDGVGADGVRVVVLVGHDQDRDVQCNEFCGGTVSRD